MEGEHIEKGNQYKPKWSINCAMYTNIVLADE